jgi:20S proteasome alpha/beta subunit
MTTIAYKDGILAGDTRLSGEKGMIWHDKERKVFRLPDGSLFGASGDQEGGEILLAALRKGKLLTKLPDKAEIAAIRVTADGVLFVFEGAAWMKWPEPFAAIGSGKRCALTALRLGFTAVVAVKQGIAGDCYSGGKVQTVKLKGIK